MSANVDFNCWNCGHRHENMPVPMARNELCESCGRDLHVCRQCRFYDPSRANACAEPVAESVNDKARANFCGYFAIETDLHPANTNDGNNPALNELFGLDTDANGGLSPSTEDAAKSALDDLFGLADKDE